MSEQQLVNAILAYLHYLSMWAIRINSGVKVIESETGRRVFRGAPAGTPDILACICGKFVGIEAKLPNNKPTKAQLAAHEEIREAGGVVIVAYSVEDVKNYVEAG
jgi:Holliday junction resolvase